jgi:ADP-heptose:LPS heptosyltransferase
MTQNPSELALELVNHCLRGNSWPRDLLDALLEAALSHDPHVAAEASHALFGIVVERLADLFEPALCDTYARLFSVVIERAEGLDAAELVARYQRVRQPRSFDGPDPSRIFVLSRVTLGADVAITSVILSAMKRRFPNSEIVLVGPPKTWELFSGDSRIAHLPVYYDRGSVLYDRLTIWPEVRASVDRPDSIVIDPDSRITQLGLLPVCEEDRYFFFESRAYGGYEEDALTDLTAQWIEAIFGVSEAQPFISAGPSPIDTRDAITVSFGVGENHSKQVPHPFERDLLAFLIGTGRRIVIDKGAGGEEAARVDRAIAAAEPRADQVGFWNGAFAPFASAISQSRLYIGYDSAGQHVAAACGVPLVSVFAGFPSDRMFARWQPTGPGPKRIIPVRTPDPSRVLDETKEAVKQLLR